MIGRHLHISAALLVGLLVLGGSCRRARPPSPTLGAPPAPANGPPGAATLAAPPVTPRRLAAGEPRQPFRPLSPGLLARTRFVADRAGPLVVEIWDVMAGPGKTSEKTRLPGAAVLEVRSGSGTITLADGPRPVRIGTTLTVDDGADLTVANADRELPLIVRATVIRRSRP